MIGRLLESVGRAIGHVLSPILAPSTDSVLALRRLGPILIALAVFIPSVVLLWSLVVSPAIADARVLARLTYANERSMGVEISDASARYLGMIHYKADPKVDYVEPHDLDSLSPEIQRRIAAYDIRPDHKTIHLAEGEVPPYFWACLVRLEDRMLGSWRNPAGIDFWTAFKIPFNGDGGSTIPMMISRHMRKTLPSRDEPLQSKIWRKFKEWEEAPAIWRSLGAPANAAGLKAWSAQHVVLLTNLGGAAQDIIPDVYGVQTAGRLLFGLTPAELSPAQQMMLAAAYRRPLVPWRPVAGDRNDPALASAFRRADIALKRWKDVAQRAEACADPKARVISASEREAVVAELHELAAHPPRITADADLFTEAASLFRTASADGFALRLEHPYSRLRLLLPRPHRRFVVDQLTDRFGRNWRDQVRSVSLTLDMSADLRFQKLMDAAWRRFETDHARGWLLAPANADAMGYVVAVADDAGRIVRFHEGGMPRSDASGGAIPRFEGGSARYPGNLQGAAVIDVQRICDRPNSRKSSCPFAARQLPYPRQGREVASVGKVLGALALADAGAAAGEALTQAFARSDNAAVERALNGVAPARLREIVSLLGFSAPDANDTPLTVAISRGYVRATPREVQRMMALALAVARGRFHEPVFLPTLVARYGRYDTASMQAEDRFAPDELDRPIFPADLFLHDGGPSADALTDFVRRTLSAPVCGGGTLRSLSKWCPASNADIRLHIAKSGTRANNQRETVDIWITGGVEFSDGRAYTYVVLAGTNQPSRPFHTSQLNAASAAGVVDALLADLLASPPSAPSSAISPPESAANPQARPRVSPSGPSAEKS